MHQFSVLQDFRLRPSRNVGEGAPSPTGDYCAPDNLTAPPLAALYRVHNALVQRTPTVRVVTWRTAKRAGGGWGGGNFLFEFRSR
jgi:hypothetical protein